MLSIFVSAKPVWVIAVFVLKPGFLLLVFLCTLPPQVSVFTELKRRNWLREQKKEDDAKQKKEKEKKKAKRTSMVVRHSALATPKVRPKHSLVVSTALLMTSTIPS